MHDIESVIWDFNGTLIRDVDLVLHALNPLLTRRGMPRQTVSSYREIFGFPIHEYYERLGFDLAAESMEDLSDEFHATYMDGLPACSLYAHVEDTLEAFRARGMRQFVLSAMEETRLREAIGRLGIADYFTAVYGLSDLLAVSKVERGRRLIAEQDIAAKRSILIGDTDHDAEVAGALGVTPILVSQGHQTPDRLGQTRCRVVESVSRVPLLLS